MIQAKVIAFPHRFTAALRVLRNLSFVMVERLSPIRVNNASCHLIPGIQSLTKTHAEAWTIGATLDALAVFEDDIAIGPTAKERLHSLYADVALKDGVWGRKYDVILLGYCGSYACTHAYIISPRAALMFISLFRAARRLHSLIFR